MQLGVLRHPPDRFVRSDRGGRGGRAEEDALAPLAPALARFACASAGRAGGDHSRYARPCFTEHDGSIPQLVANGRVKSVLEVLIRRSLNVSKMAPHACCSQMRDAATIAVP